MTLLFDFIPTMRVCVREPILLQFIADILWILLLVILRLLVMRFLILILMEFLLILVAIILRLLLALCVVYSHDSFIANSKTFSIVITIINSKTFSDSVAWFISIVRGYLRGPPYTTAPPCNAWGNTPVDDS